MEDSEAIAILFLLVLFFIWITVSCDNILWKYIDKGLWYIREYYSLALQQGSLFLPSYKIPMYNPTSCPSKPQCGCGSSGSFPPCNDSPTNPNGSQNIINIACGSSTPCAPKQTPCTKPITKPLCPNVCGNQNEVTLGCFRYILDQLPGFIYKYQIDISGNIIEDTRVIVSHTFGILKKISINAGKIVVEDSYSVEHIATVDPVTGMLSF